MGCKFFRNVTTLTMLVVQLFATVHSGGGDDKPDKSVHKQTIAVSSQSVGSSTTVGSDLNEEYVLVDSIPLASSSSNVLPETKLEEYEMIPPSTVGPNEKIDEDYVRVSANPTESDDASNTFSLDEFEREFVLVPEIPVEALQPGVSWTKLEKEYVFHFEDLREGRLRRWKAMKILDSYNKQALLIICKSAYECAHPSTSPEFPKVSPEILSFELISSELLIGSRNDKNFWIDIDVIKCQTLKLETFYVTEGYKRINSVYCVKPTSQNAEKPKEFVLDEHFENDLQLQYKFTEEARSIITKMVHRPYC